MFLPARPPPPPPPPPPPLPARERALTSWERLTCVKSPGRKSIRRPWRSGAAGPRPWHGAARRNRFATPAKNWAVLTMCFSSTCARARYVGGVSLRGSLFPFQPPSREPSEKERPREREREREGEPERAPGHSTGRGGQCLPCCAPSNIVPQSVSS